MFSPRPQPHLPSGARNLTLGVCLLAAACASPPTPTPTSVPVEPTASTASAVTAAPGPSAAPTEDPLLQSRLSMVRRTIEARGVADAKVLRAMRTVPRHAFVPHEYVGQAYDDHPLPIGYGQTISQPYIVAWMTELLELRPGDRVLEIGTGSGYQAAVLAELGEVEVFSIEIIPELAQQAAARLAELGYAGVHLTAGDGYYGWLEHAPFDAILVTAAPDHLPQPLAAQLKDGGRVVIPIGPPGGYQTLWKFVREGEALRAFNLGGVAFVPFTGAGAAENPPTIPP